MAIPLQQIFIANLKKYRKERGLSQMTLSEKCDTSTNYIGQIEMGRRIPSFAKIEKIAAALEIPSHELFMWEDREQKARQQPVVTEEYLKHLPGSVKKEIVSRLLAAINRDIAAAFDSTNY
jgi:transcriptional regulator with XRE-family HTH domain